MTNHGVPTQAASRTRRILFLVVGGLVALAFLPAAVNVLAPWIDVNMEGLTDPAQARWSLALEGVVDLVGTVCLVVALLRPARAALLVQYLLIATLLAGAVIIAFTGPTFLITVGLILLVPLTYPYPRELFSLRLPQGPSLPLFAVAGVATAVLVPLALQALRTQATLPRGSEADFNVLATNAEHLLLLALAGLLAATLRPGWHVLAYAVAAVYAYLGIVSMLLPDQPNSWGIAGGSLSLSASLAFAAGVLWARSPGVTADSGQVHRNGVVRAENHPA
jgi:hypothetical protein